MTLRTKTAAVLGAIIAMTACGTLALALGGDHPKDRPAPSQPEWPQGLAELLNSKGYLGGFFVNANDWFFYTGDAKTFNEFLARYAKLPGTPLLLTLHAGRSKANPPWDKGAPTPCDWTVAVLRRGWHPDAPPAAEQKAQAGKKENACVVMLDLWLGGQVGLDDLDVPLNVEVRSGGEIETFITHHTAKRSLEKETK